MTKRIFFEKISIVNLFTFPPYYFLQDFIEHNKSVFDENFDVFDLLKVLRKSEICEKALREIADIYRRHLKSASRYL